MAVSRQVRLRTRAVTRDKAHLEFPVSEAPPSVTPVETAVNHPLRMARLEVWPIERLRSADRKVRRRGSGQFEALGASINKFGLIAPLIVRNDGTILDGEGRREAAMELGYFEVPVAVVGDLTQAEFQALRLALNKLGERGEWMLEPLALELTEILNVDPLLATYTGFDMPEIDRALLAAVQLVAPGEEIPPLESRAVSRLGDLWMVGPHRLFCGDAKDERSYAAALGQLSVQMVFSDLPYGIKISGVVSRSHREFIEGSNLNEEELCEFFKKTFAALDKSIPPGCIVDLFIDFRGMFALTAASRSIGLEHLCTVAWDKTSAGMGGLYRHQVEYVLVLKRPGAKHINNVSLGKYGRNRTTLWTAPGFAGFGAERKSALERHPTCKPVSLLKDAILDVTNAGGVVLDMFAGSGSTLVAAHQIKRVGVGIELDPLYVDQSILRLQEAVGEEARHAHLDLTFDQVSRRRASPMHDE